VTFLGLNLTEWTAIAAIAGMTLALATTAAVIVSVLMARAQRTRDDAKREEDRQWDSDRRKEDRDRDDQLRGQDAEQLERRYRAEQRDREDYEARQVTVGLSGTNPQRIIVSTPVTYPIKWVDAQITHWSGSSLGTLPLGHAGLEPIAQDGRTRYDFPAAIPPHAQRPAVIVRFADRHGNLYYSYLHQTRRFPQNTDWLTAAAQIDQWIRTGPKPDEPDAKSPSPPRDRRAGAPQDR
jgi:hypothetical protein